MASKQQLDTELDPKYEWQENAANFVLRVHIPGYRKEDFRVQVDGAGRLTVRGQRCDGGKHIRFHKVFQLPSTSNLDDISGRFDAGVLSLTVPKRPAASTKQEDTTASTKQEDTKHKMEERPAASTKQGDTKHKMEERPAASTKQEDTKPKMEEKEGKDDNINKHKEENKAEQHKEQNKAEQDKEEKKEAAETNKAEQRKEEEDAKKKAKKIKEEVEAKRSKAEQEQKMATVKEESVLERVRRRAEEERRVKAAAAAVESEHQEQKKHNGWKEELQGLTKSEWAEGVLHTVKKNKEVIAAAVAAFSIGLFVSSRLFSRN
ncbi:hypothetical protein QOZ80_5AG0361040 [Eleusine coracana subsp. coracana]|nr:hypothetical protein QOZ80_5AG0361040 [Eleusine coracana subsp. coracana]